MGNPMKIRAANKDGFLVDLIMPLAADPMRPATRNTVGVETDDLAAVEIEGLQWLVNSPKVEAVVIDERGYPLSCVSPDPRCFALHKRWLSERADRDPLKRVRDREQAVSVAQLVAAEMPHLRFDDPALGAMPRILRDHMPTPPVTATSANIEALAAMATLLIELNMPDITSPLPRAV